MNRKSDPNWVRYNRNLRKAATEAFYEKIEKDPAYIRWDREEMRRQRNKRKAARRRLRDG